MNQQVLAISAILVALGCTESTNQASHEVRNGVDPSKPGATELTDVDGDGYADLRVLGGEAQGEAWHKIWIYDPKEEGFVWSHTTEQ